MIMKMRERRTIVAWRKERMREKRLSTVEKATGLPKEKGVVKTAGEGVEILVAVGGAEEDGGSDGVAG